MNKRFWSSAGAIALVTLALGGCASRTPAPPPSTPVVVPPPPTTPEPPVASPAGYLARAASYDQLMIRAAALLPERAGSNRLERLAGHLRDEHVGLAAQLSMAGRRLNLLPRRELLPLHQAWLSEMASAPDPAAAYIRLARRVHQNSYAMHDRFARQGSSPTLRPVARNAAETERRHWAELRR